jgi:hypothetical protein
MLNYILKLCFFPFPLLFAFKKSKYEYVGLKKIDT